MKIHAVSSASLCVLICGGYILIVTLHPFQFALDFTCPLTLWDMLDDAAIQYVLRFSTTDFILNIVLFMPFGLLLERAWYAHRTTKRLSWLTILVGGGLFSCLIELVQIALPMRRTSIFDVVSNALGTGGGALIYRQYLARMVGQTHWYRRRVSLLVCTTIVHSTFPLLFSMLQLPWPTFRNWNAHFPFQIGNEATLKRPWLGKLYLVAVYDRALSKAEIEQHFYAGYVSQGQARRTAEGLIALYTFEENGGRFVYDRSGVQPPLNLQLSSTSRIRWIQTSPGIHIQRPAVITSQSSTRKLYHRLTSTHELTLEVWLEPQKIQQHGPGRILSYSANHSERNFTLAQEGGDIHFRLRTLATGQNGSPLNLTTTDGFLNTETNHLVTTYREGLEQLYTMARRIPVVWI